VKKVVQKPHATDSKSLVEALRDAIHEANRDLKDVKSSLGHQKRWKGEDWKHYFRRRHLMRQRRKYKRRIIEGLERRLEDAIERKEDRREEKTKPDGDNPYEAHGGNIVTFDGKQVVAWIAHDLWAMRKAGWNGYVVSGWRSPEYSESLCYRMCGAPSCSGTCAGRASKHAESGDGGGAVDVTDYINAERIAYQIGSRLRNDLPYDLVHLSATGH
jgi:hypothetical protein